MRGAFLDFATLYQPGLSVAPLERVLPECEYFNFTNTDELLARAQGKSVLITNKVAFSEKILAHLSMLELICVSATGTDNIDLLACQQRNITVCNVRNYSTESVVQHTFGLMIALFNQWHRYDQAVAKGKWSASRAFCLNDYPIMELAGKTLGIIGYGTIGKRVAEVAKSFGMHCVIADITHTPARAGRLCLADLLPEVDVLSIHCPLTSQTRDLITKKELSCLKAGAILLNVSRGGIVNELDLCAALRRSEIAAGIDVLSEEPPCSEAPLLQYKNTLPNLLITPHTAWASREAKQRLIEGLANNIESYINGNAQQTRNSI